MPAREESRLSGESSTLRPTLWAGVWPGKPHFQMSSPGNPPGEAGQGPAVAAMWAAGRDRMTSSSLPLRFPCSLVQGRCSEKEPEWEERLPTSAFSRLPGEFPELCPGFHPVGFRPLVLPGVSHSPPCSPGPQHLGRAGGGWIGWLCSCRAVPGSCPRCLCDSVITITGAWHSPLGGKQG